MIFCTSNQRKQQSSVKQKMNHTHSTILCEVLVIGGSASGVCAAIQSARMGANTVLIEPSPWLGGMLTAAGVSCVDGNHRLPSGLWGEFREKLAAHYGSLEKLATGWVSNCCFEPKVGADILREMTRNEANLKVLFKLDLHDMITDGNRVLGAEFTDAFGIILRCEAGITIDATEFGDGLAIAGCSFDLGRDSRAESGENFAPVQPDNIIQDLTYVAILKDFGTDADKTIPQPPGYNPEKYRGCCREAGGNPESVDAKQMLEYGRLPNNKFMINWPNNGNDYFLDLTTATTDERKSKLQIAKNHTLGFVYFIQTELGMPHLGLAEDEFPTPDLLPFIPYIRESRRVKGVVRLTSNHIELPYNFSYFRDGIAVGDYPLDHHHKQHPHNIFEEFPQIPAFNVPFGCLVPAEMDGLLVAEKSISVTHIVNGCTRLQPVVMQIGQAAGAAAAICVQQNIQPKNVNIRELQQTLLDAGCWLMPFAEISPNEKSFQAIQRIGLCGWMTGFPLPSGWENQLRFDPEKPVSLADAAETLSKIIDRFRLTQLSIELKSPHFSLSRGMIAQIVWEFLGQTPVRLQNAIFDDVPEKHRFFPAIQFLFERGFGVNWVQPPLFAPDKPVSREEFAMILDTVFQPFAIPIGQQSHSFNKGRS